MPLDPKRLLALDIPERSHAYTARDTMLYALGVGLGADPLDRDQLRFVYEDGLQALPTMGVVLGHPGFWLRDLDTGIDWVRVLHGEQSIAIHRPIAPEGSVVAKTRVVGVADKGPRVGALVHSAREVRDAATGDLICTIGHTAVCRGDGGFGGSVGAGAVAALAPAPERAPDAVCDLPILPNAALLYRLNGDPNPLHVDPEVARKAGYERPILHGLCTFGVAGHALLRTLCSYAPERLSAIAGRFSAPVFPGESVRTEIWRDGTEVRFRASVPARGATVISHGTARLAF